MILFLWFAGMSFRSSPLLRAVRFRKVKHPTSCVTPLKSFPSWASIQDVLLKFVHLAGRSAHLGKSTDPSMAHEVFNLARLVEHIFRTRLVCPRLRENPNKCSSIPEEIASETGSTQTRAEHLGGHQLWPEGSALEAFTQEMSLNRHNYISLISCLPKSKTGMKTVKRNVFLLG